MSDSSRDAPYPELKKTHTVAHVGRPFTDYKPPAAAPVPRAARRLGARRVRGSGRRPGRHRLNSRGAGRAARPSGTASGGAARLGGGPRPSRPGGGHIHTQRRGPALPARRRGRLDGRAHTRRSRPARELDPPGRHGALGPARHPDRRRPGRFLRPAGGGHVHHHVALRHPSRPPNALQRAGRAPHPRSRRGRGALVYRHAGGLPRGSSRGERSRRCDRCGQARGSRARRGRPLRVPARRLPHGPPRRRRLRHRRARPRLSHRGPRRRSAGTW